MESYSRAAMERAMQVQEAMAKEDHMVAGAVGTSLEPGARGVQGREAVRPAWPEFNGACRSVAGICWRTLFLARPLRTDERSHGPNARGPARRCGLGTSVSAVTFKVAPCIADAHPPLPATLDDR